MAQQRRRHSNEPHLSKKGHQHRMSMSGLGLDGHETDRKNKKGESPGAPLRRGDACLMCRAKKLKCSATKPSCDQCIKRKDRCVYDAVRPASRVEKLEKKLAEMEEQDIMAALEARRASGQLAFTGLGRDGINQQSVSSYDSSIYPYHRESYPSNSSSLSPELQHASVTLPNRTGSLGNWAWPNSVFSTESTSVATPLPIDSPWPVLGVSCDVSNYWTGGGTMSLGQASVSPHHGLSFDSTSGLNSMSLDPIDLGTAALFNANQNILPGYTSPDPKTSIEEVLNRAATGMTHQVNEKDVSQSARDYLLDLFFCRKRTPFGAEMFSEQAFRQRLASPTNQPHPCLLYSVFTLAAAASHIPAVRALAESLYAISLAKTEEAIAIEDRVLDAISAFRMLGRWLMLRGRGLEAHQVTCRGMALVVTCQLNKIKSAVYTATNEVKPLIGWPANQVESSDQIHAFWSTWMNATDAATLGTWPVLSQDELIETPLPRTATEIATGAPDFTLRDLYLLPYQQNLHPPQNNYSFTILSTHLLSRAKQVPANGPESRQITYVQRASGVTTFPQPFSAKRDSPMTYREITAAIDALLQRLPEDLQIRDGVWTAPEAPVIHINLLSAKLWLHDIKGDEIDRDTALAAAKEMSKIIQVWSGRLETEAASDLTAAGKDSHIFKPWYWAIERLVRGASILSSSGLVDEPKACVNDAAAIVTSLRTLGVVYDMSEAVDGGETSMDTFILPWIDAGETAKSVEL